MSYFLCISSFSPVFLHWEHLRFILLFVLIFSSTTSAVILSISFGNSNFNMHFDFESQSTYLLIKPIFKSDCSFLTIVLVKFLTSKIICFQNILTTLF